MMQLSVKAINKAIKRYGSRCYVWNKGAALSGHQIKAFVEDYKRRSNLRGNTRLDPSASDLGLDMQKALCLYTRHEPFWDNDYEIRILYRGRMYTVDYDSVVVVANEPMYVWALLRPVSTPRDIDYADDLDPEGGVYDGTGQNGGDLNE